MHVSGLLAFFTLRNVQQTFNGLLSSLATFEPTLVKFYGFGQILIVVHDKIKKDNLASGHTGRG